MLRHHSLTNVMQYDSYDHRKFSFISEQLTFFTTLALVYYQKVFPMSYQLTSRIASLTTRIVQ